MGSASLSAKRPDRGRSGPQTDREPILREIHPLSTKQKRNPRVATHENAHNFVANPDSREHTRHQRVSSRSLSHLDCSFISAVNHHPKKTKHEVLPLRIENLVPHSGDYALR
ncbi:hypothetical protein CDAR_182551 [Caerostris darwini]|uniref:Uncharacterized protein n=1 Tax=Caerostris darwini TaxID=1538125 RepID=A0AAV4QIF9_9ARAC|nr:hypothetical protein CDAR_182551 [Caerostris darwini]